MTLEELKSALDAQLYNDCAVIKVSSGLYTTLSSRLNHAEWSCIKHFDDTCIIIIFEHKTPNKFAFDLLDKVADLADGYDLFVWQ